MMTPPDQSPCAVVVSFNPDVEVLTSLADSLQLQGCDFLVVDNASDNINEFASCLQGMSHCLELIRLPQNQGLAAALNRGLQHARDAGYAFALLFDQDSGIDQSYCADMMRAWHEASALDGRTAAIGPRLQDPETGRRTPFRVFNRVLGRSDRAVAPGSTLFQACFLITSGTLLRVDTLAQIGMMRDDYFIDNIDLEWCFRARSSGFSLYGTDQAILHHRIGEASDSLLVRRGIIVNHSPLRSYYSTRNRLNLYRQRYAPLGWKLRDVIRFVLKTVWLLLTSRQRRAYWQNIRRGINDSKAMT